MPSRQKAWTRVPRSGLAFGASGIYRKGIGKPTVSKEQTTTTTAVFVITRA